MVKLMHFPQPFPHAKTIVFTIYSNSFFICCGPYSFTSFSYLKGPAHDRHDRHDRHDTTDVLTAADAPHGRGCTAWITPKSSQNHFWITLKSSQNHPKIILKSSPNHPKTIPTSFYKIQKWPPKTHKKSKIFCFKKFISSLTMYSWNYISRMSFYFVHSNKSSISLSDEHSFLQKLIWESV